MRTVNFPLCGRWSWVPRPFHDETSTPQRLPLILDLVVDEIAVLATTCDRLNH